MEISFDNLRQAEGILDNLNDIKEKLEQRINLRYKADKEKRVTITGNKIMRICLITGLYLSETRDLKCLEDIQLSKVSIRIPSSFFTYLELKDVFGALLKMRYKEFPEIMWNDSPTVSRIIAAEMHRGRDVLLKDENLDSFLMTSQNQNRRNGTNGIPALQLVIGEYDEDMEAVLDINSRDISNTQILVAGTTGSGKSNLLAVLINQIRSASSDTHYPVNFLLFDYKGEFSDPSNAEWLQKFDTDSRAILNPIEKPLPFTPFKDFSGRPINEVNLYATSLATALSAISPAKISSNMDNRLSEAIINAYKAKRLKPVTFKEVLDNYVALLPGKKQDEADSVISVLSQLVRNNIFADEDKIDLIHDCYIINLGGFEKDGIMAKAIVYFVISKLNNIYEKLPKQAVNDERVELRHFTIIDEAHYMLSFENKPLQSLIAIGRNKGMSIILATQNMESYKSRYFDFYANAQYPLIMKQQQQNDSVLKDLFGVSGGALQEIKQVIAGLQKGELITKDANNMALGIGKHWPKIKVTHLI